MKRRMKILLILFASICVFSLLITASGFYLGYLYNRLETAEHLDSATDLPAWLVLPPPAADISYCKIRKFRFTGYEYRLPEEDFLSWYEKYPMEKIDGSTQVLRYNAYFVPVPERNTPQAMHQYESQRRATVSNGYEYYHDDGRKPSVHIVYDIDSGRAYFVEN